MHPQVISRLLTAFCFLSALPLFATPNQFNAVSGYGTHLKNAGNDISMESISLLSETTEMDGRKRLSFNVTLKNNDLGYFESPDIEFDEPGPGWNVEIVQHRTVTATPDLPPNGSGTTQQPLILLAPAADAEAVKAQVLAGQRMTIRADELYQFRLPAVAVDALADANFDHAETAQNGQVALVFSATSPALDAVSAGMFLVEAWKTQPLSRVAGDGIGDELAGLARHVSSHEFYLDWQNGKVRTTRIFEVTQKNVAGNGTATLTGIQHGAAAHWPPLLQRPEEDPKYRALIDNLRTGTLEGRASEAFDSTHDLKLANRHPWNPPLGNSAFTESEYQQRGETRAGLVQDGRWRAAAWRDLGGLFSLHFPFNDVQLAPGITLDGQMTLVAANVELRMRLRNFVMSKIGMTVTTGAEVDLRLTASAGSDNSNAPLLEREKRILTAPLFRVIFQVGAVPVEIQPIFTVDVGATLNATASVVVPIQTSFEVGFDMEYDASKPIGQQYTYTPIHHETPLGLSKPQLSQAIALEASAFVETRLIVLVDNLLGPYVGARVNANFGLTPLANPWWNLSADLDITGGLELHFLGVNVADAGGAFQGPTLFQRNAGSATPSGGGSGPLDPAEGGHLRWGRGAYWDGGAAPNDTLLARVSGTAEDVFAALPSPNSLYSPLLRIGAKGDIVWSRASISALPTAIASLPDGGVVVAGNYGSGHFLSRLDGAGNQLWSRDFDLVDDSSGVENVTIASVLARELAPGQLEIFVAGYRDEQANILKADPFLLKYDGAGTLLFATHYASPDAEVVTEAILSVDGNVLFAGRNKLSPGNNDPPGPGASDGGWLMRVNASDGNFLGAARSDAGIGLGWLSVCEAPDGRIFVGGAQFHTVLVDYPAIAIGRFTPDLEFGALVTVGEVMLHDESIQLGAGYNDWLPNSGRTPFDLGTKVAWTASGLIAGGVTGLGDDRAPLIMNFTDKLALRWFTTHEGVNADTLFDFLATDDGLLTAGFTTSLTSFSSSQPGAFFLKVPYEGKLELHPGTHGLTRYLQPSVYDLGGGYDSVNIPSPQQGYMGTTPVSLTPANQVVTTASPIPPFAAYSLTSWKTLQEGDPAAAMTFAQWAAYHQLPADPFGNPDGDARNNLAEWFFGGDPYTAQNTKPTLTIVRNPDGSYTLQTTRSLAARNFQPRLDFRNDLANSGLWETLEGATFSAAPLDGTTQALSIQLMPESVARRFFRAAAPEPSGRASISAPAVRRR